ncbi:GIN domain-containing protein [Psychroflexus sp. ALD_RP9]|uniref:GIN domain-containing protein n=1 Tax=Psychroflexus sp. ALD_RP9 TaxID=2777186 RepID=UPI001A8FEB52|nr:DUF2807 domain-containing protein [Psychroflexus sp. ALD_RP9]QSS96169.1 DUF2807 domain-containing protein [Psychroflexus sp. ALD_RP9]
MKQTLIILGCLLILISCENESISQCFQSETVESKTYTISDFDTLVVGEFIEVELIQSTENKIITEAFSIRNGKFDLNQNSAKLEISLENTCISTAKAPKVPLKLYVNNLTTIYNNSAYKVFSKDTLYFDNLKLISDANQELSQFNSGNFNLLLDSHSITIISTGINQFNLSGKVGQFNLKVYSGMSAVNAKELTSESINLFYRSSNHSYLGVTNSIIGEIRSSGNIILNQIPNFIEVESFYTGEIIIDD